MPTFFSRGFTLIELLVAISIMALVSIFFLVDFGPYKKDQALINATNDIQSFIRFAQTNATAGVLCPPKELIERSGSAYSVRLLLNEKKLEMVCENTDEVTKALNLPSDIQFSQASGGVAVQKIKFATIGGTVCFEKSDKTCDVVKELEVKAMLEGGASKSVMINSGGLIYVK